MQRGHSIRSRLCQSAPYTSTPVLEWMHKLDIYQIVIQHKSYMLMLHLPYVTFQIDSNLLLLAADVCFRLALLKLIVIRCPLWRKMVSKTAPPLGERRHDSLHV
jgi:hypothetical protein